MNYYKDLAEMYVGDDVSPDFYGWVFPKYDHVAVGESLQHDSRHAQTQQAGTHLSPWMWQLAWSIPRRV